MIIHHPAADRFATDAGWLDSRHAFSFGEWYDPQRLGFRGLRVLNDDRIAGGAGFPTHPHRDMEIITWVLEGELEHRDSTGGHGRIRPGEVQRMTAGTGIRHSEMNPGPAPVRLLQLWIEPRRRNLAPGYAQAAVDAAGLAGRFATVAAGDARPAAMAMQADAAIHVARLAPGGSADLALPLGHAWVQAARGRVQVAGRRLDEGDALAVSGLPALTAVADTAAEVLVVELA